MWTNYDQVPTLAQDNDPGEDKQFVEPEVDSIRQKMDDEFERIWRQPEQSVQLRMQLSSVDQPDFNI
ncbi:unnamed protein product [Hydatigera taeniaeformis]|uniref:Sulfatase n=1 Tax=Hydatigena taeniaeformis TaxID=6205 RepID=A0A0R3X1X4_HYDTA|nr:unnamed protein product [Hydatigera taeniaeformis]